MTTVSGLLLLAGVKHASFRHPAVPGVFVTAGNQLIGTYTDLNRFRLTDKDYRGWHAHHVVEFQDIARLGVTRPVLAYEQQLCVLVPERAHLGRVNSILNSRNPNEASAGQ